MTANSFEGPTNPVPLPPSTPNTDMEDDIPNVVGDVSMPIAIIGMGFRGPADATDVERLWRMIVEGREAWSPIPESRWNSGAFYHPDHARHGTVNVQGGHFLAEDVSLFDAPFFNMTSDEAAAMDPQQRLLLEVTYEGLENAGLPLSKIMGSQTSCFVGSFNADYTDLLLRDPDAIPMYQCTNAGQSRAMMSNRVSYFFDLKGPSVTVDTACSGSLVALHLACQTLRTGDAQMAIAAGVNVILSHEFMSTMTMMKFLSPDGRCHTFDEKANGYARGEGIGCLILKPLKDAIRDKDTIRAVIRGSGSNQDGRTPGITLPNGASQEALIRHVYAMAGLEPHETDFVETHGTGTQAGDPIETGALTKVFCPKRSPEQPLRVGSIKTNVGHLEGTSGVAGVIKAVLMLENRTFLHNRNFSSLNPRILLDEWKLKIQLHPEAWESTRPRRVSVNSFGYGGSNAHVIVEDAEGYLLLHGLQALVGKQPTLYVEKPAESKSNGTCAHPTQPIRTRLFILSAFDEYSLTKQLENLESYLLARCKIADDRYLNNLAYTLNRRRTTLMCRAAIIGDDAMSISEALKANLKIRKATKKPVVGFVFTGQGAQWCGMGRELLRAYPVFRQSMERIDAHITQIGSSFSVIDEILENQDASRLNQPLHSQTICTALQIALVDLLGSWDIHPESVTGHSSGEIAAAYAIGALGLEDAMSAAYYRGIAASRLSQNEEVRGAMLAVGMPSDSIQPFLDSLKTGKAVVACINSPTSVTVSGDVTAIGELEGVLREREIFHRRLMVNVAYHSHHMELVGGEYLGLISNITPQAGDQVQQSRNRVVSFFSSVTGGEVQASDLGSQYWTRNLLGQVKFVESVRALCYGTNNTTRRTKRVGGMRKVGVDVLLEVGPHAALSGPIRQILKEDSKLDAAGVQCISILTRKSNSVTTALEAAGTLACLGYQVNFEAINDPLQNIGDPQVLIDLPCYVWNHNRSYWAEARMSKAYRQRKNPRTDLLGVIDRMSCPFEPRWRNHLRVSELPWLRDHKIQSNIVYPAAGYISMAIEAVNQHISDPEPHLNISGFVLQDVSIQAALVIHEGSSIEVMISLKACQSAMSSADQLFGFRVYSVSGENRWTEHCHGLIGAHTTSVYPDFEVPPPQPSKTTDFSIIDMPDFYERLATIGLEYGPCFTNLTHAHCVDNICLAEVIIPDTAAVMPMSFQYPFVVHPCVLDSIFHSIFVHMKNDDDPAIPIHIDELFVSRGVEREPGAKMHVNTEIERRTRDGILASITVSGRDDSLAIRVKGLQCKSLANGSLKNTGKSMDRIGYMVTWKPDPDLLSNNELFSFLKEINARPENNCSDRSLLESCASYFVHKAVEYLDKSGELQAHRRRQLDFMLSRAEKNQLDMQFDTINPNLDYVSASGAEGRLLCALGEILPATMRDQDPAPSPIDPSIWSAYWDAVRSDPVYDKVARYLELISHKNPMISILEVEGTIGEASLSFIERMMGIAGQAPGCSEYTLTHPNLSIPETHSQRLSDMSQWLSLKRLDVEQTLETQGFDKYQYDVVLVPYGLYMARSKRQALRNLRDLLKPQGQLIIVDPVSQSDGLVNSLIFAGFSACWSGDQFGTSQDDWKKAILEAGFSDLKDFSNSSEGPLLMVTHPLQVHPRSKPDILIISEEDENGVDVLALQKHLSSISSTIEITNFAHAEPEERLCVLLSGLTSPLMTNLDKRGLEILQQILLRATGVLWVTRGSTMNAMDPNGAITTGFARTARSESGIERIVTLDLDGQNPLSSDRAADIIYTIVHECIIGGNDRVDMEYAERDGVLLIPRVVENKTFNESFASSRESKTISYENFHQTSKPIKAMIPETADADSFCFEEDSSIAHLPTDYVRIQVHATCVDKQNAQALKGLGISSTEASGCGISGVVEKVGQSVHGFLPGDRVACFGFETVASYHQDAASAFQKLPSNMSVESAAALPVSYCTALYATQYLARAGSAARILIYGAARANRQAFAELCQHIGANAFFLVRSEAEKNFIISEDIIDCDQIVDIRDLTYVPSCGRAAKGKDFDVIISCVSPDNGTLRLLWKSIATSGTFIQLCNHGDSEKRTWTIPRVSSDVTFATFDIHQLWRDKPVLLHKIWSEAMRLFNEGRIPVPKASAVHRVSDMMEALTKLESDEDMDLITLTAQPGDVVKVVTPKLQGKLFQPDVSYMLVGGLGGIGRATALWMSDNGARTLIFVNRSGLTTVASQGTAKELEENGTRVIVHACDISDSTQVENMLNELAHNAPPIRGVIQAAMVLRDIHIEKMTIEDYHAALQPKHAGTWNLHRYLPSELDWFIMLSSISGIIGNATQAAYAAGSTFLDAFAAYRNALGQPAVSLDLGAITDAGYLADNRELASKMAQQGFHGTDTATLMSIIETAIRTPFAAGASPQVITGLGHWKAGQSLSNFDAPLFAHFRRQFQERGGGEHAEELSGKLRESLREIKSLEEASGIIYTALSERIASHLSMLVESISPSNAITEYGIDSHMAVELRNWVAKNMESTVPILDILASSTLLDLAGKIASKSNLVNLEE
ncbi:putative polyketide synthase [Aspergillus clavatus NRRL 1]|uniref:Polyketide synthase, putative n=1 Tax=Aspergillus clavatus (strain ATCC 1007 / CBS 513.65 / DSM 816 / NCTC 3887 / NRRL 1 / QM 1276 / 107) TaxID=344612 RepID=A1CCS9_ASPCL|nr:polyketide synthase, putative [Aspergillus clavatus NRRL 1]EAW12336.1 polyketide synthase, putative [Aspergillus clavatus NRRL 1]